MDKFSEKNIMLRIDKTMNNLRKNNMEACFVHKKEDALKKTAELIKDGDTVSVGGSMTLFETGVIDYLRNCGRCNFLDRYEKGLTREQIEEIFRKSFFADDYIVSTNALTEDGELYNVDGNGNRVSAMIYGPKSVIVIAGVNKIVSGRAAAVERVRKTAAPANALRLKCAVPCAVKGECMDCGSDARICCSYVFLGRQRVKGRIKVIIAGEPLGY